MRSELRVEAREDLAEAAEFYDHQGVISVPLPPPYSFLLPYFSVPEPRSSGSVIRSISYEPLHFLQRVRRLSAV
jgi:hypothetical protein